MSPGLDALIVIIIVIVIVVIVAVVVIVIIIVTIIISPLPSPPSLWYIMPSALSHHQVVPVLSPVRSHTQVELVGVLVGQEGLSDAKNGVRGGLQQPGVRVLRDPLFRVLGDPWFRV